MTTPTTEQFVLNIPTDSLQTVTECLCKAGGHALTGDAATDQANAKQTVINFIVRTVQNVQAAESYTPPAPPAPITGLS